MVTSSIRIALVSWVAVIALAPFAHANPDVIKSAHLFSAAARLSPYNSQCNCTVPTASSKLLKLPSHRAMVTDRIHVKIGLNSTEPCSSPGKVCGGHRWRHWLKHPMGNDIWIIVTGEPPSNGSISHTNTLPPPTTTHLPTEAPTIRTTRRTTKRPTTAAHVSSSSSESQSNEHQSHIQELKVIQHMYDLLLVNRPEKATNCNRLKRLLCADDESCHKTGLDARMLLEIAVMILMPSGKVCH